MAWLSAPEYWLSRLILERGIAVIYVFAFVAAARQFRALIGEHGLLPVPRYVARQSFARSPSIFHFHYSDRFFATVAWSGAALSVAMAAGLADVMPLWAAVLAWLLLWSLYLSIVNVGQTWYSFGWESLMLETGFLATFLGDGRTAPPVLAMWLARLLLFRVEFGAGLIKLRGDSCWRDLTCLDYHHETQPMPGPLSWFFHHLPKPLHRVEVAGNHVAQLIVPFGLFAPQPVASIAGAIVVVTQLWLVTSGNFAWLNWLTILLAFSAIDASSLSAILPITAPAGAGRCAALVHRAGSRVHGADAGPELLAGAQHDLPPAADEYGVQPLSSGQHLRGIRQHRAHPPRSGDRGHRRSRTSPSGRCGGNTNSKESRAGCGESPGSGRRITCAWTG